MSYQISIILFGINGIAMLSPDRRTWSITTTFSPSLYLNYFLLLRYI